jgi:hypothetical protein
VGSLPFKDSLVEGHLWKVIEPSEKWASDLIMVRIYTGYFTGSIPQLCKKCRMLTTSSFGML